MKTKILLPLALLACSVTALRATEEPSTYDKAKESVKETAHEVADGTKKAYDATKEKSKEAWTATKDGTKKAYDKTADFTKDAAEKTKEKSKEAWTATKDGTKKAYDKTVDVTKDAAQATKEKTRAIVASKEELASYDTNKDGKLDDAEYARLQADKAAKK